MREMLITVFSDADPTNTESLKKAIDSLPGIQKLKYEPEVRTEIVDEHITEIFSSIKLIPSLTFLDPWGYKGLSYQLINSVIKDWGCDCIVFFNYNRINMGLGNDLVKKHIDALFGEKRAANLRAKVSTLTVSEREEEILTTLSGTLKELGGEYILPFRFRGGVGNRISHHLVFVTKHQKGYDIMKNIMAKASSSHYQEVPSFEYSPQETVQPYLLPPYLPLDNLKNELTKTFAGQSLSVLELYDKHNVGTHFIKKNYKRALRELEENDKVVMNPPADERRTGTLGDNVIVTFP